MHTRKRRPCGSSGCCACPSVCRRQLHACLLPLPRPATHPTVLLTALRREAMGAFMHSLGLPGFHRRFLQARATCLCLCLPACLGCGRVSFLLGALKPRALTRPLTAC